mmetsp:Transcript_95407/g.253514  ORF Transcript_95407/g.253514 Transcript_95407/m.253514 type:complete len:224 (+) Transcript_95407:608-1279(+)
MKASWFSWMARTTSGFVCAMAPRICSRACGFCAIIWAYCVNCGLFLRFWSTGGNWAAAPPPPPPVPVIAGKAEFLPPTAAGAAAGGAPPAAAGGGAPPGGLRMPAGMPFIRYSTARSGFPNAAPRQRSTSARAKPISQSCEIVASAAVPVTRLAAACPAASGAAAGAEAGAGAGAAAAGCAAGAAEVEPPAGGLALAAMTTMNCPSFTPMSFTSSSSFNMRPE